MQVAVGVRPLSLIGIESCEHERKLATHLTSVEVRFERAAPFSGERAIEIRRELAVVGAVAPKRVVADQNAQIASSALSMRHTALSKHKSTESRMHSSLVSSTTRMS